MKAHITRLPISHKWVVIWPLGNWAIFDTFRKACGDAMNDPRRKEQ